jgi:hypothetical protein
MFGDSGSASASQDSSFSSTVILTKGSASASAFSGGSGSALSLFFVSFDLTAASNVSLVGSLFDAGAENAIKDVKFSDTNGALLSASSAGKINYNALLPAGTYSLEASVVAMMPNFNFPSGSWDLTLTAIAVPEPSTVGMAAMGVAAIFVTALVKRKRSAK